MADKSEPATNADKLAPASELSTDQALNGMHALPASLGDIAAVTGLKYVKAKDKVLLVQVDPHRGRADHPLKTANKAALAATVAICSVNEADKTIGLRISEPFFRPLHQHQEIPS